MYKQYTKRLSDREAAVIQNRIRFWESDSRILSGLLDWIFDLFPIAVKGLIYTFITVGIWFLLRYAIGNAVSAVLASACYLYFIFRLVPEVQNAVENRIEDEKDEIKDARYNKKIADRFRSIISNGTVQAEHIRPIQVIEVDGGRMHFEDPIHVFDMGDGKMLMLSDLGFLHIDWMLMRRKNIPAWPNTSFDIVCCPDPDEYLGVFCYGEKLDPVRTVKLNFDSRKLGSKYIFEGSFDTIEDDLAKLLGDLLSPLSSLKNQ